MKTTTKTSTKKPAIGAATNAKPAMILSELTRVDIVKILARRTGAAGETFNLAGMKLAGIDFTGMDLSRVDFSRADMRGCIFRRCELRGADFRDTNLTGADFRGAHTQAVGKGDEIDLSNANLTRTNLDGVDLSNARGEGAKFIGASLGNANFTDADLWGAIFTGATTTNTNFTRAWLDGGALDDVHAGTASTMILVDVDWKTPPKRDASAPTAGTVVRTKWWESPGVTLRVEDNTGIEPHWWTVEAIREHLAFPVVVGTLAIISIPSDCGTGGKRDEYDEREQELANMIRENPAVLDTFISGKVLDCRWMTQSIGTAGLTDAMIDSFCDEMDDRMDAMGLKWVSGQQNIIMPDGRVRELHEPGQANGDCSLAMYMGPLVVKTKAK